MNSDRKTRRDDDRGTVNTPRLTLTADTKTEPTWPDYGHEYEMPNLPRLVEPAPLTEAEYEQRAGVRS